jgi:hypothetical protein
MAYFPPKFPDCTSCKIYRPETGAVKCLSCGAGEFFEEKVDDHQPNDNELMEMFRNMRGGNGDDE